MDRIRSLSQFILHHILSFVDIKTVVQTSILSKNWKDVWVYLPIMNFKYDSCQLTTQPSNDDEYVRIASLFREFYILPSVP